MMTTQPFFEEVDLPDEQFSKKDLEFIKRTIYLFSRSIINTPPKNRNQAQIEYLEQAKKIDERLTFYIEHMED